MNKKKLGIDIPVEDSLTGVYYIIHEVELCKVCNGLGFSRKWPNRTHDTLMEKCYNCNGDGRMIKVQEKIDIHPKHTTERNTYIPYSASNKTSPYLNEEHRFCMKRDLRDPELEAKYPDLAALSYDKYDELLEKYRLFEIIKQDEET